MKRVSFEVAKVLKEADYPQECDMYYSVPPKEQYIGRKIAQPTYLDAWIWLWREKGIHIEILDSKITTQCYATINGEKDTVLFKSPEEAIKEAINYLIENNLI